MFRPALEAKDLSSQRTYPNRRKTVEANILCRSIALHNFEADRPVMAPSFNAYLFGPRQDELVSRCEGITRDPSSQKTSDRERDLRSSLQLIATSHQKGGYVRKGIVARSGMTCTSH